MKTSSQIRAGYLKFFQDRGHTPRPSAPLIPQGDATLMFNSAGMVPFKPYFLGLKKDLKRATSCQKCFRTTDIDRVGMTLRHLTFFEMLGNFSFGDYFKPDAINWAWEFLTKDLGFDPKLLHPTVFTDDSEAEALWKKQSIVNPVVRLGADSNFWSAGPVGPCGPCSEIYVDRGPEYSCGQPTCAVGCDCDRYLEIWNLVFMQYNRQPDGSLKDLPAKNIDTGAGLERVTFALQGKPSPFDTDLFAPIVADLGAKTKENERAFRVIADHVRASTMLLAEGVIPSNVDRGYVLRRLIRRALRYGQLIGRSEPFLYKLVPSAMDIFKEGYPELRSALDQVQSTLKTEESKFLETLERGEFELAKLLDQASRELPGEKAFWLYETFGFPFELTQEACSQRGITVDETGFKKASEKAADIARASWKGSGEKALVAPSGTPQTKFLGYESMESPAKVLHSGNGFVILDQTPFYPEGGGQIGDTGWLMSKDGKNVLAEIVDTQKANGVIFHIFAAGSSIAGDVVAKVDASRRARIRPHHTGTHLMNEALKRVLGTHIRQAGSYVGPDKLRFDFTHPKPLTPEEIAKIEKIVNDEIAARHQVVAKEMPVAKVQELGATTLLGEDYGANPRFLIIGAKGWDAPMERFSLELCGGTHCSNTEEIGGFKIVKESSAAAGVRRIEALTALALTEYTSAKEQEHKKTLETLAAKENALLAELGKTAGSKDRGEEGLRASIKALENELKQRKASALAAQAGSGGKTLDVKGLKLSAQRLEGADPKSLRGLSDKMKTELGSGLVFLAAPGGGKLSFVLAATPDLAAKGVDAAKIAKAFAAAQGGSAGGRADFAQGGVADGDWDKVVAGLTASI